MMRTVKVKLNLDEGQKISLLRTMEAYTDAFDRAAKWGYQNKVKNKFAMNKAIYYPLRGDVPALSASLIQSAMFTACEALKGCKMKMVPRRRKHAAVRYTWNEARVWFESGKVSISSVDGRVRATFVQSDWSRSYLDWTIKASILTYDKEARTFYLGVIVEMKSAPETQPGEVLGIDRGLNNLAVCSNNMFFDSARVNGVRGRYAKNKAELQAKGTRSAKRRLRQQAGRERRFMACENHRISKTIVNTDFSVFALEDLKYINTNRWLNKGMRRKMSGWAYYQLEWDIRYKAEALGKQVVLVDATCTSQWCSRCGWIDKASRKGSEFHCVKCGFILNADLNASRNLARLGRSEAGRLSANQPYATGDDGGSSGARQIVPSPVASSEQLVLGGRLPMIVSPSRPHCENIGPCAVDYLGS